MKLRTGTTHSIGDHALGGLAGHAHRQGEFDHDHDEDFLAADSTALESVTLLSMGVDIGSSSTQIAFTRLTMRGPGEPRALRGREKSREILFLSSLVMTPFLADGRLDAARLRGSIARAFRDAELTPDDVETGVVLLTGAAARSDNAAVVAALIAEDVGDLVCAAAGHHMEATLAAYGSGALEASRAGVGRRVLNIDIGGATTKLAIVEDGRVVDTAALAIGGRLLALDRDDVVVRCDAASIELARRAGFSIARNEAAPPSLRARLGEVMAAELLGALQPGATPPAAQWPWLTPPLADFGGIDGVRFSGGVAEYVYGREQRDFGDLGRALGVALRRGLAAGGLAWPLEPPGECIRATVIGASGHSVQVSGQTIYISNPATLLPRRNLAVVQVAYDFRGDIDVDTLAECIVSQRAKFDLVEVAGADAQGARQALALAFAWRGAPDYGRLRALAEAILLGSADAIARGAAIYILLEGDAAFTLGAILHEELHIGGEILVLDGLQLRPFDFVDIGRLRLPSGLVPVTIKSMLFADSSTGKAGVASIKLK